MYKNITFDKFNNKIHLWDDIEGYSNFEYKPFAYIVDPNGEYVTIDGHKVKKVHQWSESAEDIGLVYEHDVSPIMKTLIEKYWETDDISQGIVVMPLDIEVAKEGAYSTPQDADNTITSISYFNQHDKSYYCLLLDKNRPSREYSDKIEIGGKKLNVIYFTFKSEFDLLKVFLREFNLIKADILTGWNVEWFDIPYLYNRITKVLGKDWANGLSPIKRCHFRNAGEYNNLRLYIDGISIMDYLTLYKKFTFNEQPNYKLDTIAKIELGRGKIEYEGDLDKLYETDIMKFAEYNIVDVELIVSLDEKLQLLDIARGICHKGHVPYEDFIYSSKYLDGASLVYCKRNNLIASSNKSEGKNNDEQAEGAFVKMPKKGLHKWVIDLDLESLYPGNIRTLNISPETKFGRILNYDQEDYIRGADRKYIIELIKDNSVTGKFNFNNKSLTNKIVLNNSNELKNYVELNKLSISSNGILYDLSRPGLIPSILTLWFQERKEYQSKKKECDKVGNKELSQLYDKKQLITKILLNSFYGVLLLKSFRFYDKENGEAVTTTGKSVIGFSMKAANHLISNELNIKEDYCIYGDTDSVDGRACIRINGEENKSIDQTFDTYKQISRYVIDRNGREFIFPNISLPYFEEKNSQVKLGKVQYIERHLVKKRRFELKSTSGKTIIVTEDHSIMILRNGQLVEVKPLEIKVNDKIISIKC